MSFIDKYRIMNLYIDIFCNMIIKYYILYLYGIEEIQYKNENIQVIFYIIINWFKCVYVLM